jgi:deaminated glutathione amidase
MSLIACIQMASGPNVQANLGEAARLIRSAVAAGAGFVLLPEHFAQMGMKESDKLEIMETEGKGPIQSFLAETARQHRIWVAGGSIPLRGKDPKRARSSLLLYNDQGVQVARYDKIHMFDVHIPQSGERYQESATIEPGDSVVVVDTPLGRTGLCVCYDMRFPELFRQQVEQGMEVLLVPSAFTAITGKVHWEPLLVARAIENQCYVAAANQGGYHINGRETHGHSMIVDPWGAILDCLPSGSGFVIAKIDRAKLESTRKNFPAISHRRLSCSIV